MSATAIKNDKENYSRFLKSASEASLTVTLINEQGYQRKHEVSLSPEELHALKLSDYFARHDPTGRFTHKLFHKLYEISHSPYSLCQKSGFLEAGQDEVPLMLHLTGKDSEQEALPELAFKGHSAAMIAEQIKAACHYFREGQSALLAAFPTLSKALESLNHSLHEHDAPAAQTPSAFRPAY